MNKNKGNNSYDKWALAGQNNGTMTKKQRAQSINDKRKNAEENKWQMPVQSSKIINYRPRSIMSEPGTTKSVLALKYRGKPAYRQMANGEIRAN